MRNVKPKVKAAGIGGSVATLIVAFGELVGVEIPPEVAAALATVISFVSGWFKSE